MSESTMKDIKDIKKLAGIVINALEAKKAEDIRVIDISEISILADYFIIANGSNSRQIQAFADEIEQKLAKEGCHLKQAEGYDSANWILLDFGDLIVHLFDKENRSFYNLERIWRDGKQIDPETLR